VNIDKYISKHLSAPKGIGGNVVSFFMNRQNRPMYNETIRLLLLSNEERILDIGCGNGYVLNMIAKKYNGTFTGIDLSKSIIESAMKRNRSFVKAGKMAFFAQDLSAMSFADESFSRVYAINTVYFWDNLGAVMKEVSRILKPGGILVNSLYSNDTLEQFTHTRIGYKRFSKQKLVEAGVKAGFSVQTVPILSGAAFSYIYKKPPNKEA